MRDGSNAPGGFEPYCSVSRARSGVARVNPLVRVWTESATHTPTTPSMADAHQAMTWAHNFGTPWSGHEASTLDSNASCPRLRVVAPRVFLFSFVYGGDPVMMHHFCHHYFERVGVLRTQARFILQSPRNATLLNQTLAELDAAGVPAQNISIRRERYSDVAKLLATNALIDQLSPGSLLINADGDELFWYPCNYENCMLGGSCCATFRDRLAATGRVASLKYAPSIEEQFPLECNLRAHLRGMRTQKHTLLDPYWAGFAARPVHFLTSHQLGWGDIVGIRGGNHTYYQPYGNCLAHHKLSPYQIAHYTMTTTQRDLALEKASNWSPSIDFDKGDVETYSCAGQRRKGNVTYCNDYLSIVAWMEAYKTDRKYCSRLSALNLTHSIRPDQQGSQTASASAGSSPASAEQSAES